MKVLHVEDNPRDSVLIERELGKRFAGVHLTRVETPEEFAAALDRHPWDVIVADHNLPRFSSLAVLEALRAGGHDIPVVVVSGTMGLKFAVEAMRAGARDYLVKSDLVRLNAVIEREVHDAAERRRQGIERRRAEEALRASEERYRVLVETSPNGVALTTLDGTILKANGRLAEMVCVDGAGALEGGRLVALAVEEDRSRAEAELAAFVEQGSPRESLIRFRRGEVAFDGEVTWAVTNSDAAAAALVVIIRDVTERRRLQARVAQSDRMASVGMLAAGVAHEINNPLTYLLFNLESLGADLRTLEASLPRGQEPLDLAQRSQEALDGARRIRGIVRDIKVFARVGDERLEPVSINEVIDGVLNMTHNEVKFRARLVADFGTVAPVLANEGRLAQVFLNLLVNAAQALREGDVEHNTIHVRTWSEPGLVLAEVRDTGPGIPVEFQSRIFEPFFTTKPAGIGSGLGLAISREIVEELGGRISVESQPGEGARFVVQLPAAAEAPSPAAPLQAEARPPTTSRRGRVLVVDDEAMIRSTLVRMLRGEHEVIAAENGHAAETLLAADDRFDVILCDLIMPEVSGMDLYDGLITTRPELASRMVFMSGGAFTQRAMAFLEAVPNMRIEKPFDSSTLREQVRALVAARPPQAPAER